ncbi:MAG: NAD-dependent epimerase/dehydratase family protein [Chitinophagales bacterium]|nr:NAD-dependent epimerase/dehydratase family protein [Chitinophagales bacterium]
MRILVTGGAGYIGTELVRKLAQRTDIEEIVILDNLSRGLYNMFLCHHFGKNNIRFVQGDILDTRTIRKLVKKMDVVYHLAAMIPSPYTEVDPHLIEQTNLWGTAELTYAVEDSDVKKFVHISSISVYGSSGSGAITENTALNPRTNYGISKMRGESFVAQLIPKLDTYIVRCGNIYGYSPSMRFDAVINRFAFEANFHKRISIHGTGKQIRSFIHVDRLSQVLSELPFHPAIPGGIYNLVDHNRSVMDIALTMKEIYPAMEMIFINQQLRMRNLKVEPHSALRHFFSLEQTDFKQELEDLIQQFSFHP